MDCQSYITAEPERKREQHLGPIKRGVIQELRKLDVFVSSHCPQSGSVNINAQISLQSLRNEVSRQYRRRQPQLPDAAYSYISCFPTGADQH